MDILRQCKEVLIEYKEIEFAYVFGSFAKGEENKRSDLDIAIYVSEALNFDEYLELKVKLERACKREVDLVVLNEAGTLLKREINLNHRLIFSRNDELESNHRVKVVFEYADFKKYVDMFYEKSIDRISQMEISIEKIERFSEMSFDEFSKDEVAQDVVEYNLFICINAVADIVLHIVSDDRLGVADTMADAFEILKDKRIISEEDAEIYRKMVGLRNILAHEYLKINKKTIYEVATKNLIDIKKFMLFAEEYC